MTADLRSIRRSIRDFDFTGLFIEELGWDRFQAQHLIEIDGHTHQLTPIAEKRGFQVFRCAPEPDGSLPDRAERQKIDNQVAKAALEHLIVYTDAEGTTQRWQWALRQADKPVIYREDRFDKGDSGERLAQKLRNLFVSIDEDERLTLVDVTRRASQAFQKDRVTRKFYERFDKERRAFLPKIENIPVEGDRAWYASIMLNRLMFVYFIQKKGFLNGDQHYLRSKLRAVQQRQGRDQFYGYYREFLLKLFHDGLAAKKPRPRAIEDLLGDVPYLNGGIFEQHQLEQDYPDIQIPDAAFERIFAFFDDYDWHLDDRPLRRDDEINPDVLGYIFEKYINQKQMGAYYTKEDITEYISKNTIVPFLFDAAKKDCAIAFRPDGAVWGLLKDNPDRYIYDPVKKGVDLPLPPEIAAGLDDVSQRGAWNRTADEEYALPTEIWREHVARRRRYEEVWGKLVDGQVSSIDDLITYNLDVRQFAQDVIQHAEGPELVRAFFKAIHNVSVLDPTCGSGAFLFAALNILAPLYDACLERMEEFIAELDRSDGHHPGKYADFRATLAEVGRHASRDYYIYKSIILNNLYGVDIMEEAVEICKLRLFLKLVAQLGNSDEIEPLPDIDFNIRAGNTLVGFTTLDEVRKAIAVDGRGNARLPLPEDQAALQRIEDQAEIADRAFQQFRVQQTEYGGTVTFDDKRALRERLANLSAELDRYLARLYGIDRENISSAAEYERRFEAWRESHEPIHWLVDFFGIMHHGGFDTVIGNPQYVEYSKVRREYTVLDYEVEPCGNLFPFVVQRSIDILRDEGRFGMVLQHSAFCTPRMKPLMDFVRRTCQHCYSTFYESRPAKLFDGIDVRLAIPLMKKGRGEFRYYGGRYFRFFTEERPIVFEQIEYVDATHVLTSYSFLKIESDIERSIAEKLFLRSSNRLGNYTSTHCDNVVYYSYGYRYWARALTHRAYFRGEQTNTSTGETLLCLTPAFKREVAACLLDSSLFYWYYSIYSDGHNFTKTVIYDFPFDYPSDEIESQLVHLSKILMEDLRSNTKIKRAAYKTTGNIEYEEYYMYKSKSIIDEIDRVLAQHYGFTDEELDFIINYDIKYRMGLDALDEDA